MKKFKMFFIFLILAVIMVLVSVYFSVPSRQKLFYGVTFSQKFAEELGLDWQKTYSAILDDLKVRKLRLIAYWDLVEPEDDKFNFENLDWQVAEAEKRNANIILVLGRKTPRWPECHIPNWALEIRNPKSEKRLLLRYVEEVVKHYRDKSAITAWQVENEPLFPFGECGTVGVGLLNREIELVRSLDSRPIILTDAGELGFAWPYLAVKSDIFGTTLYRYVSNRVFGDIKYWFIPAYYFRVKTWWAEKILGKDVLIAELQAEPWVTKLISTVPLDEQYKTMNPEIFKEAIDYAERSGFPKAYFWGVEWWYWLKEKKDMPEMWEAAKSVISNFQ